MTDWITRTVGDETFALLAETLAGSELQSVMLEVMARRAAAPTPVEVLRSTSAIGSCRSRRWINARASPSIRTCSRRPRASRRSSCRLSRRSARARRWGSRTKTVDILARADREEPAKRICAQLGATLKPLDKPYYSGGIRYMLWVTAPDGIELPLIDGGAFDWLAKLTSNRRHAFVTTGGGAQLVQLRFRR